MGQLAETAVQFGGWPQIWQVQRQPELHEISVSKTKPNYKKQTNKQKTENGCEGRNQHVVLDSDGTLRLFSVAARQVSLGTTLLNDILIFLGDPIPFIPTHQLT